MGRPGGAGRGAGGIGFGSAAPSAIIGPDAGRSLRVATASHITMLHQATSQLTAITNVRDRSLIFTL